jgi:cytochrome c-type biogenesis protein CcmH/NrfG
MKTPQPAAKNRNLILLLVIFIGGFLTGVAFTSYKMSGTAPPTATGEQAAQQIPKEQAEAIAQLEGAVTSQPNDYQAWIRLGHLYFDTHQPEKAIQAYTRSIELHPPDANLLTDLGVMYRNTEQKEKAIESFDRARQLDPQHEPSRLNKGIVQLFDLNDPQGAIASWEELLRLNPEAKMTDGSGVRQFIDGLQKDPEKPKDK